jgi:20S proteasome subunit alpha 2
VRSVCTLRLRRPFAAPAAPHCGRPPRAPAPPPPRRAMTDSASFSLTTFSPSGKLVQIEYALNAVAAGATCLGIKALDGVVLATEKKLPSTLVDEATVAKISLLTPHVGTVYAGMGPDARVLAAKARKQAQVYYRTYHESVPVAQLVRETATVMQEFTQSGCVPACGRCQP